MRLTKIIDTNTLVKINIFYLFQIIFDKQNSVNILYRSMKKCIHIDYYAFNQEFIPDNIDQFALV